MTLIPAAARSSVVVELPEAGLPSARVVLAAALQLFGPTDPVDVVVVLPGVEDPQPEHALALHGLALDLVPDAGALPELVLMGPAEAAGLEPLVVVAATGDEAADARAVVLLSAAAQQVWGTEPTPAALPAEALAELEEQLTRLAAERDRAQGLLRVARRDVRVRAADGSSARRPCVVLLFQHRSYWGAVATLWEALRARSDVEVQLVALDSNADGRGASTAAFLADLGVAAVSPAWLLEHLDEVDVVVLDNPYDELRPAGLRVPDLVARGVRLAVVPYGGNAIAGPFMDTLLWDLPLQRAAWRAYLASPVQGALYARHCRAGGDPVRVLGAPKMDRVVHATAGAPLTEGARALRAAAGSRPLILWNPHFRLGEGGWSTFDHYLEPLLQHFAADPSQVLLLRPHFRLFADLHRLGGPAAEVETAVRAFVARHENVLLDESPDCLDALTACDAMLSDLSSLATELLPSGKPILYLHRSDGPGPNEEGAHFRAMYRGESWDDVVAFLQLVGRREDPQRASRMAVVADELPFADGRAGKRIAEDLVAALRAELALAPVPVEPVPVR